MSLFKKAEKSKKKSTFHIMNLSLEHNETSFLNVWQKMKDKEEEGVDCSLSPLEEEIRTILEHVKSKDLFNFSKFFSKRFSGSFTFHVSMFDEIVEKYIDHKEHDKKKIVWMLCSFLELLTELESGFCLMVDGAFRLTSQCMMRTLIQHIVKIHQSSKIKSPFSKFLDKHLQERLVLFAVEYCVSIENSLDFINYLEETGVVDFLCISRHVLVKKINDNLLDAECLFLDMPDHDSMTNLQHRFDELVPISEKDKLNPACYFKNSLHYENILCTEEMKKVQRKQRHITKNLSSNSFQSLYTPLKQYQTEKESEDEDEDEDGEEYEDCEEDDGEVEEGGKTDLEHLLKSLPLKSMLDQILSSKSVPACSIGQILSKNSVPASPLIQFQDQEEKIQESEEEEEEPQQTSSAPKEKEIQVSFVSEQDVVD